MAFEVDSIEAKETEFFINGKNKEENTTKMKSYECQNAAIMDRYFLRKFNRDPLLLFTTGKEHH